MENNLAVDVIAKYSVNEKVFSQNGESVFRKFLAKKEAVYLSYKNQKQVIIFTDRKIIVVDHENKHGVAQKIMLLPYHNISSFSVESCGNSNGTSEFSLLISGIGVFDVNFGNRINCHEIGQFLSHKILSKELTEY